MLKNRLIKLQITNYLAGECSPAEQEVIAGLIQTDAEYRDTYAALKKIWDSPALQPATDIYNVDAAWVTVSNHIRRTPLSVVHHNTSKKAFSLKVFKYAASIAAVLLLAFSVFQVTRSTKTVMKSFVSGTSVSVPLALADGSSVVMNAKSELKYPEKFGSDTREVYFWGEAFFEIASDPARPFVIESGDARIKVLGTSFNLKADAITGITEVVVNSGTVLFYHVDQNENILGQLILHKGDKGIYNGKTRKLAKSQNTDLNVNSWKTGILVFNETSLDVVMEVVGRKYDVNFRMSDSSLSRLKLTATFDNESLDSVLEVLRLVHKLQFTQNGKDYLVKK